MSGARPVVDSLPVPLPEGVRFVDAFAFDVNGVARGKRLPVADWAGAEANGVAFSASALVLDATGASRGPLGLGTEDGDPDAVGWPVAGTLVPVPWAMAPTAQCLLAMRRRDGAALWFDPRVILQGVVDRCRADGLHPVVACELEFYLLPADGVPAAAARAGHLCVQQIEAHAGFLHALHAALEAQGVPSGAMVSEYGPGQFELNLAHGPEPVRAADQAAMQRRAAVGVAAAQGMRASFMAKPFAAHSGCGLHVHVSLVDGDGRNRFELAGGEALLGRAVAGMQRLHGQSMALFAPSFSAYRRYRAGSFVALGSSWGDDNRSVAFRVPAGPVAARRVEHRVAGAEASPHLVMAAVLAAVHHGVTQGLEPGAASVGNADGAGGAVPRDVFAALAALEGADVLGGYFGGEFLALFAALKRAEAAALLAEVAPRELEFYL